MKKDEILRAIGKLPDNCTLDEIIYHLLVLRAIYGQATAPAPGEEAKGAEEAKAAEEAEEAEEDLSKAQMIQGEKTLEAAFADSRMKVVFNICR